MPTMTTRGRHTRDWLILLVFALASLGVSVAMGSTLGSALGGGVVGWCLAWLVNTRWD